MDDDHKPLELPDKSASDKELDALSTLRHVKSKLAQMGVEEPMKPESGIPDVPPDISEVSDREIGDLYSGILAWDSYFSLQTAWADAEVKEAKNKLELIIVKQSGGKKRTRAYDDEPRVLEARAELQAGEQLARILEANHKVISSKLRMISRNIELRKLDWEKSVRESNIKRSMPHTRMGAGKPGKRD